MIARTLFALIMFTALVAHAQNLSVEVAPEGLSEEQEDALIKRALETPRVRDALRGINYRVVATEINLSPDAKNDSDRYLVQVYDYTHDRLLTINGSMLEIEAQSVIESEHQPLAVYDEFLDAIAILKKDPVLGPAIRSGELDPYTAMPSIMEYEPARSHRVIPVGLEPAAGSQLPHEIVTVDLSRLQVQRYSKRAPANSIAKARRCGPRSARQRTTRQGRRGSADITIKNGNEVLWTMKVIRPSASSGMWGSGVELRDVKYKGVQVLSRAHAPILNVKYENDICGPFRDPVNQEDAFVAKGRRIASGILKASEKPSTIFDTRKDRGNFWGVAIHETPTEVTVLSELSAGWYRYVSEFAFLPDGTIKPTFRFDSVHNSCTCQSHIHHIYWRFDFDIGGAKEPNSAEVQGKKAWRLVNTEEKHLRDKNHQSWKVFNPKTNSGYLITAGPNDVSPDEWGKGDAWILKRNPNEIDDARVGRGREEAMIDEFINGESVKETDIVFWYGGHVVHADGNESPHVVGPVLTPWKK